MIIEMLIVLILVAYLWMGYEFATAPVLKDEE